MKKPRGVRPTTQSAGSVGGRGNEALAGRRRRRLAGVLAKRLPEAGLAHVRDPRSTVGRRWPLVSLCTAVLTAMVAGCRSFAQMEAMTGELSLPVRRMLGLRRRVPDTTARALMVRLEPEELQVCIHRQMKAAHRRKALPPEGLPFGVTALDGKVSRIDAYDRKYSQRVRQKNGVTHGLMRTVTAVLTSARARPCIDVTPIPTYTNEQGHFLAAVASLEKAYGSLDLFRLVTYDAGACSFVNARFIAQETSFDYLLRVNAAQPKLFAQAEKLLGCASRAPQAPDAVLEEKRSGQRVRYELFTASPAELWRKSAGAKALVRVQRTVFGRDGDGVSGNRYWVTSLAANTLTPKQWLQVARGHWGVENNAHHTLDAVFKEDDRPWITSEPRGTLALMILRRIAYNILTLYRSVSTRSETGRKTPWRHLLRGFYLVLVTATAEQLEGLREVKHCATPAA